jgi:hypothetical protein
MCTDSSCDVALGNHGFAPGFICCHGSSFAASDFKFVLVVNLANGGCEGDADNELVVVQLMFLDDVYVRFLVSLVSADFLDLVLDGVNGNMVVVLACNVCGIGRFGVEWGITAKFVDFGERWVYVSRRGGGRIERKGGGRVEGYLGEGTVVGL